MGLPTTTTRVTTDIAVEIHRKPGYLIRRAHQMSTAIFIEQGKEFDLTPVQYGSLQVVEAYPGIDQAQVGRLMGLDRTTLSDVVRRMVTKGLLDRKEHNRRTMTLHVTGAGRALLQVMARRMESVNDAILEPLNATERRTLLSLLAEIIKSDPPTMRPKLGAVERSGHAPVPAGRRRTSFARQSQERRQSRGASP